MFWGGPIPNTIWIVLPYELSKIAFKEAVLDGLWLTTKIARPISLW
jgi:hypothetical protein